MKKINIKLLILCLAIPLLIGGISGLISSGGMRAFEEAAKPPLTPSGIVFPIVWTILYALMGISSYMIVTSNAPQKETECAILLYAAQLFVNFLWSPFFFNLKLYFFSFAWLILLWVLILMMILRFYRIRPLAAYLQIPYLLWVTFAGYLNLGVAILNR